MVIDAMCGFGLAAHVSHLLRFVVFNNLLMEVTMRINFHDVWKLVAQRVPKEGELTCAGKMGNALSKA